MKNDIFNQESVNLFLGTEDEFQSDGNATIRLGKGYKIWGIIGAIFFGVFTTFSIFMVISTIINEPENLSDFYLFIGISVLFALFAFLSIFLIIMWRNWRITVCPHSFCYRSSFGKTIEVPYFEAEYSQPVTAIPELKIKARGKNFDVPLTTPAAKTLLHNLESAQIKEKAIDTKEYVIRRKGSLVIAILCLVAGVAFWFIWDEPTPNPYTDSLLFMFLENAFYSLFGSVLYLYISSAIILLVSAIVSLYKFSSYKLVVRKDCFSVTRLFGSTQDILYTSVEQVIDSGKISTTGLHIKKGSSPEQGSVIYSKQRYINEKQVY